MILAYFNFQILILIRTARFICFHFFNHLLTVKMTAVKMKLITITPVMLLFNLLVHNSNVLNNNSYLRKVKGFNDHLFDVCIYCKM